MSIGYRSVYLTLQRLDGSFNFPEEQPKPEIVRLQNIFFTFLVHLRASCRVILDANPIFSLPQEIGAENLNQFRTEWAARKKKMDFRTWFTAYLIIVSKR